MRVDRSLFLFLVVTVALSPCSLFSPLPLQAQETKEEDGSGAVSELPEPLNDIKILAQQAALPSLRGESKFILRESWWSGHISPGKAKLIQVQLFRRNEYQFWLAVPNPKAELNLNVYDSEGKLVPSEIREHSGTHVVSTIVKPDLTGVYYVRVSLKTTLDQAQDWAVIYAYR